MLIAIDRKAVKAAVEHYGAEAQLNVAIEEMSELTKEICKSFRGKNNRKEIVEETGDVLLMLENIVEIFGIDETELSETIMTKQLRLTSRIYADKSKRK